MRRYRSLNDYLKDAFGEKVYKLALDGGMTCPNLTGQKEQAAVYFAARAAAETSRKDIPATCRRKSPMP